MIPTVELAVLLHLSIVMYQTMSRGDKWDEGRLEKKDTTDKAKVENYITLALPIKLVIAVVEIYKRNISVYRFWEIKIMLTEEGRNNFICNKNSLTS